MGLLEMKVFTNHERTDFRYSKYGIGIGGPYILDWFETVFDIELVYNLSDWSLGIALKNSTTFYSLEFHFLVLHLGFYYWVP